MKIPSPALFVMCPHSQHMDGSVFFINGIDKPVLNTDSAGIKTGQVPDQLFIPGDIFEWIIFEKVQQ